MSGSARSPITPSAYRCTTQREAPGTTQMHILRLQPHHPEAGSNQAEALFSAQAMWSRPRLQRRSVLQRPGHAESWGVVCGMTWYASASALHCFTCRSDVHRFAMLGPSTQGSWAVLARVRDASVTYKLSERRTTPRPLQNLCDDQAVHDRSF